MALLVLVLSLIIFPLASRNLSRDNPSRFQHFLELVVGGLKDLLDDVVGHGASKKYLYIIGGFACFIFMSNIFGLFFFLQPPTSNPNTTFALGLTAFLYYNAQGIKEQGLLHYLKHFTGPIAILAPLFIVIEIIGHLARILSLGMRLFGGIFGAFLQTFVFIMMTMVYIGGAVTAEEH
jgi:F-type H+-transporting ATPase subunit a